MTAQTYAARDVRVPQWLLTLFRAKDLSPLFLNGRAIFQSALTKKEAAVKTSLSQSASTKMKALLHFHGTGYVSGCLQNSHLRVKLH